MDLDVNPNGSVLAIEGITSPDGRVFGKMGHSERSGDGLYKNVPGDSYQQIFEGGVDYFRWGGRAGSQQPLPDERQRASALAYQRLSQLDDLYKRGAITEEEYALKKQECMRDL